MKCIKCEKTARAICQFCGRALCKQHIEIKPFISAAYDENNDNPQFIITENAVWCGLCNPTPSPIKIPETE